MHVPITYYELRAGDDIELVGARVYIKRVNCDVIPNCKLQLRLDQILPPDIIAAQNLDAHASTLWCPTIRYTPLSLVRGILRHMAKDTPPDQVDDAIYNATKRTFGEVQGEEKSQVKEAMQQSVTADKREVEEPSSKKQKILSSHIKGQKDGGSV